MRNYSRKKNICTCECSVYSDFTFIEKIIVKYEIEFNKDLKYKPIKNTWSTQQYFGEFKKIVELPKFLETFIEGQDYKITTSHFTRDKILVPYVSKIQVENLEKYQTLKKQHQRKNKLKKINLS